MWKDEIVSYSKELMDFDIENVTLEELDRRLELAVANVGIVADTDICGGNCGTNCGTFCGTFSCTANCGAKFGTIKT